MTIDYTIGTMIEVPRAALTADEIARQADFFSFGTNDLTQMTLGFSRDDAEGKFLTHYLKTDLLKTNPFEKLDQVGVGQLIAMAVQKGRSVKPELKTGICGEHGGEPTQRQVLPPHRPELRQLQPLPGARWPGWRPLRRCSRRRRPARWATEAARPTFVAAGARRRPLDISRRVAEPGYLTGLHRRGR